MATEVVALTLGRDVPSARFRVRQYSRELSAKGLVLREMIPVVSADAQVPSPSALRRVRRAGLTAAKLVARGPGLVRAVRGDVTLVTKAMLPGYDVLRRVLATPLVYDIDDAVWLRPPHGREAVRGLVHRARSVTAGNAWLADWCSQFSDQVHVIPTAVDTDRFMPVRRDTEDEVTIGWTGTAANLGSLRLIEPALRRVVAERSNVRIAVVCDEAPTLSSIPSDRIQFVRWHRQSEAREVQRFSIGVMPLHDSEWSRGKCAFKLLQYMACAVPFVASPVGVNCDLVGSGAGLAAATIDEWTSCLLHVIDDETTRRSLGERGRDVAVREYSVPVIGARLAARLLAAAR